MADATFLAAAGLNRLGLSHLVKSYVSTVYAAVAQGAIGIERRNFRC